GRVILQTYLPDHPAIQAAAAHDYEGFYARELAERQPLGYPPAMRLANVVVSATEAEAAAAGAVRVAAAVRAAVAPEDVTLVGPAPCPLERLRGRSRHHCLLKARAPAALERVLWMLARRADELVGAANRLEIDRDPLSML
ncbi:MAG: primosomal protein N', partial [Gemmatimonadota bacterium]